MIKVSEVIKTKPENYKNELQKLVYETFDKLNINFERVDSEPGITMEDCLAIDARLDVKTVKSLFLCNRQKTNFYLYIVPADKVFVTKEFGKALGVSRVSFADEEYLIDIMGTKIGATTIFSMLRDEAKDVRLVIDKTVLDSEYFCGTDGVATGFVKIKMDDLVNKLIPYTKHELEIIEM